MILDRIVSIFAKTTALNSEGKTIPAYSFLKSVSCNIQPLQLTDVQRNGWGISDLSANAKLMFVENFDAAGIVEDYIVRYNSKEFTIKGINPWDSPGSAAHTELLLKPIQGVTYT
jgi:hypothetical protein